MAKLKADILITNASQLVTVAGRNDRPRTREHMSDLGVINDGAVAISGNTIIAVDETSLLEKSVENRGHTQRIDASGKLVMPGFVDSHVHLIFAGTREDELAMKIRGATYQDISKKGGGILRTVEATRKASREELTVNAKLILDRMLTYGTTTAEAKSGYGLTTQDETKCLEVIRDLNEFHPVDIVSTLLGAHAVPPEYSNNPEGYVKLLVNVLIPTVSERKLAEFCDVFCENGYFTIEQSRTILEAAKKHGLKLKIHADELSDLGGARLAADVGAQSADHLLHVSTENMKVMARSGVVGVLLPATPFSLMIDSYADARRMINEGVPVAIATDLSPNSMTESMQMIITLACLKMKMFPEEAIVASTINAAHAVNRASEVGSLEAGKKADILIADVPTYRHIPYHFGVNLINTVIKSGKIVVKDGVLLHYQ